MTGRRSGAEKISLQSGPPCGLGRRCFEQRPAHWAGLDPLVVKPLEAAQMNVSLAGARQEDRRIARASQLFQANGTGRLHAVIHDFDDFADGLRRWISTIG